MKEVKGKEGARSDVLQPAKACSVEVSHACSLHIGREMSSGDEGDDEHGGEDGAPEMSFIAGKVREHPEILEKSQLPAMKTRKSDALRTIVQEYVSLFGKEMNSKAFMKKVNNMKTRLKSKTDKNKTGNKRIRLLPWEKTMLEAMNADVNPVLYSTFLYVNALLQP
jgi:hypothetical protein